MKKQNGITLIALVITIVVLLILAGVSMAMVLRDNGILSKAKESQTAMKDATVKEYIGNAIAYVETEALTTSATVTDAWYKAEGSGDGATKFASDMAKQNGITEATMTERLSKGNAVGYTGTVKREGSDTAENWVSYNGTVKLSSEGTDFTSLKEKYDALKN